MQGGAPHRIVSLVPSHTETLHDLGLAGRVVGRTRFCIHPAPWVDAIPTVGGTKDVKLERILELKPDLVVCDKDENPKALVDALLAAGVEVLWSDIGAVADAAAFIEELGAACGAPEAGRIAAENTLRTLLEVRQAWQTPRGPPSQGEGRGGDEGGRGGRGGSGAAAPLPVFCPIWHDPWMTFDHTAYPSAMLEAVGLHNVFAHHVGAKYFQVEARDVAASGAHWTLLPSEPYPFHRKAVPTSDLGPCGAPAWVKHIDGEALTWFGTRTQRGLRELQRVAQGLRGSRSPYADAA